MTILAILLLGLIAVATLTLRQPADPYSSPALSAPRRAPRRNRRRSVEIQLGLEEILARGFLRTDRGPQRHMRIVDQSETRLGIEGPLADCAGMAAGDLIGIRLRAGEALLLGRVMRSVAANDGVHMLIGVQLLNSASRPAEMMDAEAAGSAAAPILFVPGLEPGGSHAGFLFPEAGHAVGEEIQVQAGSHCFNVRFDRIRERGRGWALAGFEVL